MIEIIGVSFLLCTLFFLLFMYAKSTKEDLDRRREIELALNFYPEGYAYVNNILNGFDETVIDKTKGFNMSDFKSDFKVGDWVKHEENGWVILSEYRQRGYWNYFNVFDSYSGDDLIHESGIKKLYKKFDKFKDIFSETPVYVDKTKTKFKVGDKVTNSLDNKEKVYTILKIDRNDIDNTGYYIDEEFSHWCSEQYLTKYIEKKEPKFKIGDKVKSSLTGDEVLTIIEIDTKRTEPYRFGLVRLGSKSIGWFSEELLTKYVEKEPKFKIGDKVTNTSLKTKEFYIIIGIDKNDIDKIAYLLEGNVNHWCSEQLLTEYIEKEKPIFEVGERVVVFCKCFQRSIGIISGKLKRNGVVCYYTIDGFRNIHENDETYKLHKLNDPEILRVGDKVKYVGCDANTINDKHIRKNTNLIIEEKNNSSSIKCIYDDGNIKAKFTIEAKKLELILD